MENTELVVRESRIVIRQRPPIYKGRKLVQPEYAIIANMDQSDSWLSIQRRDRKRFDGDRDIVCDLAEWR